MDYSWMIHRERERERGMERKTEREREAESKILHCLVNLLTFVSDRREALGQPGYGTTPVGCRGGNRYVEGEPRTFG